jgi:hypothetical protein
LAGIFWVDWLTSGFSGSGGFSDGKPNVENVVAIVNFESYFAHDPKVPGVNVLNAHTLNANALNANALHPSALNAEVVSVVEVFIGLVGVLRA